jgi:hypothetical protein
MHALGQAFNSAWLEVEHFNTRAHRDFLFIVLCMLQGQVLHVAAGPMIAPIAAAGRAKLKESLLLSVQ